MSKSRQMRNCASQLTLLASALIAVETLAQAAPVSMPTGRFGAVMEFDASVAPSQTVYRPRDLASGGFPIIAWGNGGCANDGGATSRRFLMQVASEGYIIVAPGKPGPDSPVEPTANRVEVLAPVPAAIPAPAPSATAQTSIAVGGSPLSRESGDTDDYSKPSDLVAGLDWAVRESKRKGSIYYQKLATAKIAVMGRSCGGLQAIEVQGDPRIVTTMIWNSGTFDPPQFVRGTHVTKESLNKITRPIAYIAGGPADIAHPQAADDVARINTVPLFFGEIPVGHAGTMGQANGGSYAQVAKAWLDWRLKGDVAASRMFVGPDCTLCKDPDWTVKRKNLN